MNKLDELIETAPYVGTEWTNNALHYLKNYRDTKEWLELEKKNYAEAVKNCERAESKYTKLVLDMNRNDPLTWEELEEMKDKPLWFEWVSEEDDDLDFETAGWINKYWCFIYRFLGKGNQIIEVLDCVGDWHQFYAENLGTSWNAYRKERA